MGSKRDDRAVPLRAALDDLQAQLEAGDRTFVKIDHQVDDIDRTFDQSIKQADLVGKLRYRLTELREHLLAQRAMLRDAPAQALVIRDLVRKTRTASSDNAKSTAHDRED